MIFEYKRILLFFVGQRVGLGLVAFLCQIYGDSILFQIFKISRII